jgi:hypothetical protein
MSRRTRKHGGGLSKSTRRFKSHAHKGIRKYRKLGYLSGISAAQRRAAAINKNAKPLGNFSNMIASLSGIPMRKHHLVKSRKNSMRVSPTRRSSRAAAANATAKMAAAAGR